MEHDASNGRGLTYMVALVTMVILAPFAACAVEAASPERAPEVQTVEVTTTVDHPVLGGITDDDVEQLCELQWADIEEAGNPAGLSEVPYMARCVESNMSPGG